MGKSYYEYIDRIADRFGVTIDYLVREKEIKTDSLSWREVELVERFQSLADEVKDAILENVRLLAHK